MMNNKKGIFLRLFRMMPLRIRWTYLPVLAVEILNASVLLNIIIAFILKDVINAAISGDASIFNQALMKAGIAIIIGVPASSILSYIIDKSLAKNRTSIRVQVFNKMINLPQLYLESQNSGDLISRITNDLDAMAIFFRQLRNLIFSIALGSIAFVAISILDWRFGLLVLLLGGITFITSNRFKGPLRRQSDDVQKHLGFLTEGLIDLIMGIRQTKMFLQEEKIHGIYTERNKKLLSSTLKRGRIEALFGSVNMLILILNKLGVVFFGMYLYLTGDGITLGTIAAILHLQSNADYFSNGIGHFIGGLQHTLAGAGRVFEILDTEAEPERISYPVNANSVSKNSCDSIISIRNLNYSYDEKPQPNNMALKDISMDITPGQRVALVGPSGGGKTTLLKLLLGFYIPDSGNISIDGKSICHYTLHQLRDKIAYVPQDAYLFCDTIEENIKYGKLTEGHVQIAEAAKKANAHDFILAQPAGYNTLVGEMGSSLSGGQQQCIAMARALLKDAPILVLDEASSALDSESEQMVQTALETLMNEHTTIAIAHRLSTVKNADVIYVIDKGQIVEQGSHETLMAEGGLYNNLYELQFATA